MRTTILILGAAALLTACGSAKDSFDQGFDKKFHESFTASCVKSAIGGGAPQQVADTLCKCASDKIKERFSVKEKMSLKNDQIIPIVQQCRDSQSS